MGHGGVHRTLGCTPISGLWVGGLHQDLSFLVPGASVRSSFQMLNWSTKWRR